MTTADTPQQIAAEAYLSRLAERGIDYVFANAGTDFAPIVEALSRSPGSNRRYPRFITVPHENVAMAMAHGYYRIAGKPAVVMCHVTVGTANCINGLMNATRDNVPVILAAGRTPITETGHKASRQRSIHWGQEAFDQGGMVREFVKWDYEFRAGQPVEALVDRALDIAMSEPRGPVYLTLPREVLCDPAVRPRRDNVRPLGASAPAPSQSAIEEAARMIAEAEFPLVVTSSAGRSAAAFDALAKLADTFALPVVQSEARDLNLSSDHPMNFGFDVGPWLPRADVVVVLDSAVPWIPRANQPKRDAKVIHISSDPLLVSYPFREFEADLIVTGEIHQAVTMLHTALQNTVKGQSNGVASRRKIAAELAADRDAKRKKLIETAKNQMPIHPAWLGACLNAAKAKDAIIVSELGVPAAQLDLTQHGTFMGNMLAGGLGMGLGAALGAKLAAPEREVIAVVGDGSYMFGNPLPFHYVAHAESLPTLTIVANNQSWHAVRRATLDVYPDGDAAKANIMPLTELKPSPAFEKIIEAAGGGLSAKVENPADLPKAIEQALAAVRSGTPAVLNVATGARS
jgi:acetolactate synthase-1/2/3 large subunit